MRGFFTHLTMSLRLNFRNPQAVVFGYVVPIFFLFAFGSYFYSSSGIARKKGLVNEMGQLITISVMGGACFGMPITFVSERERGVWRRYRLTPLPTGWFVASLVIARFLIVLSAGIIQYLLAHWIYGTPWPAFAWWAVGAFCFVCFAFLGIGLLIAMIANSTGAVQALGQALFLPMILIGGVGVPLRTFSKAPWVKILAGYLPGIYAVKALDAGIIPLDARGVPGDVHWRFDFVALALIGAAASFAAAKIFRWENEQRPRAGAWAWTILALGAWAVVGITAHAWGIIK